MLLCKVCGAHTVTRRYGNDWFVMCESDPCRSFRDGGAGRPLSGGHLTPLLAEQDYADEMKRAADALAGAAEISLRRPAPGF